MGCILLAAARAVGAGLLPPIPPCGAPPPGFIATGATRLGAFRTTPGGASAPPLIFGDGRCDSRRTAARDRARGAVAGSPRPTLGVRRCLVPWVPRAMETPRRRRCLCPAVCFRFSTRRVRLRRVSRDDVHRGPARCRTRAAAGGVWTPTRAGRAASSPPRTPPRPRPRPPPLGDAASARTRASPSRAARARVARACEAPRMRPPPARRRRRRVSICRRSESHATTASIVASSACVGREMGARSSGSGRGTSRVGDGWFVG